MGRNKARRQQLQHTIDVLQKRWGPRAIRRMEAAEATLSHPALPTGFREVDRMLGIGGLPKGRFTELLGSGTAGQATLAAKALCQAQKAKGQAVYVDVNHAVDLDFLHRCGVRFDALAILRPWDFRHALEMTGDLLREGAAGALVFDRIPAHPPEPDAFTALDQALRGWNAVLPRTLCAVLFLTEAPSQEAYPAGVTLPFFASVRLLFQRKDWLYRRRQVRGFTSVVTVLKNRFGPSGQSTVIRVAYTNHIGSEEDG